MKNNIKRFNESGENSNGELPKDTSSSNGSSSISDINKFISAKIMTDEEIESVKKKQEHNIQNFKDIFDEIEEVSSFEFANNQEKMGAIKALNILKNYILNRNID